MWGSGWRGASVTDSQAVERYLMSSRHLTPDDIQGFTDAAETRQRAPRKKAQSTGESRTVLEFVGYMNKYNKVRYWRLRRDMNWFLKQAAKHGVDPDTARRLAG